MTPIAWYDPTNKVVSKDKHDPAFTVLGQVLPLYSPAERKPWVGLTDAQIGAVAADIWGSILIAPQSYQAFARAIEAKLKDKNG